MEFESCWADKIAFRCTNSQISRDHWGGKIFIETPNHEWDFICFYKASWEVDIYESKSTKKNYEMYSM